MAFESKQAISAPSSPSNEPTDIEEITGPDVTSGLSSMKVNRESVVVGLGVPRDTVVSRPKQNAQIIQECDEELTVHL